MRVRACVCVQCSVRDLQRLPGSSPPSHQPPQVQQVPLGRRAPPWTLAPHGVPATYTHAHMAYTHAHMLTHSHSPSLTGVPANQSQTAHPRHTYLAPLWAWPFVLYTHTHTDGMGMCVCVCVCGAWCMYYLLLTFSHFCISGSDFRSQLLAAHFSDCARQNSNARDPCLLQTHIRDVALWAARR